jgi:type IV pilus assembly protein PilV
MAPSSIISTRGFSLVEVMTALLVLAIGVLALLMLQLASLRTTRETLQQSSALQLATDIAEQIKGSTHSPEMLQHFSQFDYVATGSDTETGGDCYGIDSDCTPAEIATSAMGEWRQRLRETLPGGRLRICHDASPWQASRKSMQWECDAAHSDSLAAPIWIKVGWPLSAKSSASPSSTTSRSLSAGPQLALPVAAFSP